MPLSGKTLISALFSLLSPLLLLAGPTKEKNVLVLTEEKVLDLVKKDPPNINQLKSAILSEKLNAEQLRDRYQWEANARAYRQKTSEQSFAPYIPVTSPIDEYEIGVRKNLSQGMGIQANAFSTQSTNSAVMRGTEAGLRVNFSMDLHKDFLGKLSQAELSEASLASRKSQLRNNIQASAFEQEAKKLYWSLVANEEKLKVSRELLETAKQQAEDARERLRNNITDRGEVARYEAQVASRESEIVRLEYVRSNTLRSLKELFPEISAKKVVLGDYQLQETIDNVLKCTEKISASKKPPLNYTYYDEILALSKKQYRVQKQISDQYDTWDLSLNSQVTALGKQAGGYNKTFNQLRNDHNTRYSVALEFSMPLDKKKTTTEDIRHELEQKKYIAEQEEFKGKIQSFHTQTVQSIALLQQVVKSQGTNADKLAESLEVAKKKYNQARISFREVVQDQDALLQSHLTEIDTKLTVIQTIFDYFSIFNQTPCEVNSQSALAGSELNVKKSNAEGGIQ